MATVLQFKRSVVEGAVPSSGALADGEIAINTVDGKVFLKKSDNTVVPVSDWTRAIYTASTTDTNQVVDTFSVSKIRSAKYIIQATRGSEYHMTEVMVIHNGTHVYMTEYSTIYTGSTHLILLDADINGGNVRLLMSPTFNNTVVRTARFDTLV